MPYTAQYTMLKFPIRDNSFFSFCCLWSSMLYRSISCLDEICATISTYPSTTIPPLF